MIYMKRNYCPPRCLEIQMSTYGEVALGAAGSGSVPEESQLAKPSYGFDEGDTDTKGYFKSNSPWSDAEKE